MDLKLCTWLRIALLVGQNGSLRIPILVVLTPNGPLHVSAKVGVVDSFKLEDLRIGDGRLVCADFLHSSDRDKLAVGCSQLELRVALFQREELILGDGVLAGLDGSRATHSGQVLALAITEGDLSVPEDQRVECVVVDAVHKCASPRDVLLIGEQDGVATSLELQRDNSIGTPRDQLVALQLVAHDVAVGAPVGIAQVDLRVHRELQRPEVGWRNGQIIASQVVARAANVSLVGGTANCDPPVVLGEHLEFLVVAHAFCSGIDFSILVGAQVASEVAFQGYLLVVNTLQGPDLLCLQGSTICSDFVLERLGCEVLVARIYQTKGPGKRCRHCVLTKTNRPCKKLL